jgi:protein transport protein SEC23
MIGLITYGKMVYVHELGFADCPKCYVFRGDKEMNSKQV